MILKSNIIALTFSHQKSDSIHILMNNKGLSTKNFVDGKIQGSFSAALRFIPKEDLEKEGYGQYKKLFENKN